MDEIIISEANMTDNEVPDDKLVLYSCEPCDKHFQCLSGLKSHFKWKHNQDIEKHDNSYYDEVYSCEKCGARFRGLSGLKSHHKWKHNNLSTKLYSCDLCGRAFAKSFNLKRHIKNCNSLRYDDVDLKIKCSICNVYASSRVILFDHYKLHHSIDLNEKEITFKTLTEFHNWKDNLEYDTTSEFVKKTGTYENKGGKQITKYFCHRDGYFKPRGERIKQLKKTGSNKIGSYCPARMYVYALPESITVKYIDTHIGHEMELERLTINKLDKDNIALKLSLNIPYQDILDEIRDSAGEDKLDRIRLITQRDLHNIAVSYKLNQKAIVEENPALDEETGESDEYFEDRKHRLAEKCSEVCSIIESEEQLQAASEQVAYLERIVESLSKSNDTLPTTSYVDITNLNNEFQTSAE